MLTCGDGVLTDDAQRLEVGGAASYGHLDNVSYEREAVEAILREVERSARLCGGDLSVDPIDALFLHVDSVLHPAVVLGGSLLGRTRGIGIGNAGSTLVVLSSNDGAGQLEGFLVISLALGGRCEHVDAAIALIGGAIGGGDDGLEDFPATGRRGVLSDVGRFGHRGDERRSVGNSRADVEVDLLDGLRGHACTHLDGNDVALGHLIVRRLDIDRGLLLHAGEGTLGVLSLVSSHVFLQPGHGRTLLAALVEAGVVDPCGSVDVTPQGDAGTVLSLPHRGEYALVLICLLRVVGNVDIQLRDVHRHFQRILLLLECVLQFGCADIIHIVRLVSVGIDGSTGITYGLYQRDVVVDVPPDGVVVVVDEDGIGEALVGHFEGLDQPVVARLAAATDGGLDQRVSRLVHADSLVDNVDEGQRGILLPDGIEPRLDGIKAVLD